MCIPNNTYSNKRYLYVLLEDRTEPTLQVTTGTISIILLPVSLALCCCLVLVALLVLSASISPVFLKQRSLKNGLLLALQAGLGFRV